MVDEYGDEYDEFETEEPQERPNPMKQLRTRGDKLAKENKELKERLENLERAKRQNELSDTLKTAGVPVVVANLIPNDTPADKVGEWLQENGFAASSPNSPQKEAVQTEQFAEQAQVEAMQSMAATGSAPSGTITEADLASAPSYEAFLEILRRAGNDKFQRP